MILVTIPTNKSEYEIAPLVNIIEGYSYPIRVYASCHKNVSASVNRNACINEAIRRQEVDRIIMVDDDMRGFYKGWCDAMVAPLEDPLVSAVSARLITKDGAPGFMMGMEGKTDTEGLIEVNKMPSACIAFRVQDYISFCEEFKGSGFEDLYWCWQHKKRNPEMKFIVNADCKLIHLNEQKNQSVNDAHNRAVYERLTK